LSETAERSWVRVLRGLLLSESLLYRDSGRDIYNNIRKRIKKEKEIKLFLFLFISFSFYAIYYLFLSWNLIIITKQIIIRAITLIYS
jgi:hypothetical protein